MPENPAPGWYPDPEGSSGQRYWDGARWTDAVSAGAGATPAPAAIKQDEPSTALLIFGYLTSFLLPLIGFIIGIVLLIRGGQETKHGIACVLISLVVGIAACQIVLNDAEDSLNESFRSEAARVVTT
jgi:hypothetical protein